MDITPDPRPPSGDARSRPADRGAADPAHNHVCSTAEVVNLEERPRRSQHPHRHHRQTLLVCHRAEGRRRSWELEDLRENAVIHRGGPSRYVDRE